MSDILGVNVASTSYAEVVGKSVEWARARQSRTLVFANVHVIMEAFDNPKLRDSLNAADLVNPDGVPLVWALKLLGHSQASRVYGPDCTLAMLAEPPNHKGHQREQDDGHSWRESSRQECARDAGQHAADQRGQAHR